ncbi:Zinc finger BED domain-containing protein RICESLEEPER 1 [Sesamum alatum]|uniref:Zinc finger BED domain-containing protein RICESLEEPER 1 n=1 Tax=Sesamum alatum TaxID=300844 RepID=A0AAE1XTM3_9LAMI|nr:Zinc finger BED domain-containing protein RICESLEEPER 1 [Sesamum alatum]
MKDADEVMKISCMHCKRMYTKSKTAATTQLHRHLQSCANYLKAKADKSKDGLLPTQLGFVSSSVDPSACPSLYVGKFDMEKMKESVAHWIMMHEHPFSIVEEEGFNLMQRRGMPKWRGMTRNTAKAYCINVYESEKKKLKNLLKNVNKISLTTDCWKSKNQKIKYMVITGHWIDESWQLQNRDWGIESKIHTISVDNASANDSAIDNLKDMVARMKVKFDKYWGETNLLLSIAAVLDPRCKLRALEFCFPRLYSLENVERQIAIVQKTLYELYSEYVAISNIEGESI